MKLLGFWLCLSLVSSVAVAESIDCNLKGYKTVEGVKAEAGREAVTLTWPGEGGQQLRAQFGIRSGQPVVKELAARTGGGQWVVLGKDLQPDFQITTGRRRISNTQRKLLQVDDTPEQENIRKWNTFWDAPLQVPGGGDTTDLPRKPEEIHRASVSYQANGCEVTSEGTRVSISFNGLTLGQFSGTL
jgi:hypothetical protein